MGAVRFDGTGVRVEDLRRVRPAAGEVLVRVSAVAVDRGDAEPDRGPTPVSLDPGGGRTLGRHAIGTVAGLGVGVDGWPLGRAVVLQPELTSTRRRFVPGVEHDGALADYISVPADALVATPKGMDPSTAVQLPLAARAASALSYARVTPGDSVGIWGAGALGALAITVARLLGAAPIVVVDPDESVWPEARALGADVCLSPDGPDFSDRLHDVAEGPGLDVALHLAPTPTAVEQLRSALGPTGRAVLAGPAPVDGSPVRWDARTWAGLPPVDPEVLPRLARLAQAGRLVLPTRPVLAGGLHEAAELLDGAVRADGGMAPTVVRP